MQGFFWDAERIRYYIDAAEQSAFHRSLAALLSKHIKPSDRVLDAGCGLGYLSEALTAYCAHVTAADLDPNVIAALKARTQGAPRLSAICADVFSVPLAFDVIVCCYFGSTEEALKLFDRSDARKLILIKRRNAARRFSDPKTKHFRTAAETEALLIGQGRPYEAQDAELELSQPFRSIEDAERFFEAYRSGSDLPLPELEKTGDDAFPYRLPVRNAMRIFFVLKDCDPT